MDYRLPDLENATRNHGVRLGDVAARTTTAPELQPRQELVNPALDWLAELTREEFQLTFRGSPVKRAKYSGLRRNAAVAMGNSGEKEFVPQLEKLAHDEDSVVQEHAKWALERLQL